MPEMRLPEHHGPIQERIDPYSRPTKLEWIGQAGIRLFGMLCFILLHRGRFLIEPPNRANQMEDSLFPSSF
jgi:hypothetical protein